MSGTCARVFWIAPCYIQECVTSDSLARSEQRCHRRVRQEPAPSQVATGEDNVTNESDKWADPNFSSVDQSDRTVPRQPAPNGSTGHQAPDIDARSEVAILASGG